MNEELALPAMAQRLSTQFDLRQSETNSNSVLEDPDLATIEESLHDFSSFYSKPYVTSVEY